MLALSLSSWRSFLDSLKHGLARNVPEIYGLFTFEFLHNLRTKLFKALKKCFVGCMLAKRLLSRRTGRTEWPRMYLSIREEVLPGLIYFTLA